MSHRQNTKAATENSLMRGSHHAHNGTAPLLGTDRSRKYRGPLFIIVSQHITLSTIRMSKWDIMLEINIPTHNWDNGITTHNA